MKGRERSEELQKRRLRAGRLLRRGVAQAEVARRVGASRASVHDWNVRLNEGGLQALRNGVRGRPAGLDAQQLEALSVELKRGARVQGYATELWTLGRIGKLVQQRFGLKYSLSQLSRILAGMGWSSQKPEKRALQRDEAAIAQWKRKRWPALKKTPQPKGARSSS